MNEAYKEAKKMEDQYISVEHLLLGFYSLSRQNAALELLNRHGVTKDEVLKVLRDVRGGQRVTSDNPKEPMKP